MNEPPAAKVVDTYFSATLGCGDATLDHALAASERAGLPSIAVSATFGKLLHLMARSIGARRILEIGTLGGYSAIWLARALPADGSGKLITLEADPKHAEVAKANIAHAGCAGLVDVRIGDARDTLPKLAGEAPFDFTFIDADKQSNAEYFGWALKYSRPGSIIVVDNVVRGGAVADAGNSDPSVQGVRRLLDVLSAEKRVSATAVQTVGAKGYDGFAFALVLG